VALTKRQKDEISVDERQGRSIASMYALSRLPKTQFEIDSFGNLPRPEQPFRAQVTKTMNPTIIFPKINVFQE
jgi:hypothetical protein